MLKLTAELINGLKKQKKERGNIMKAALTMEKFGMEYAKRHLRNSKITRMVNESDELGKSLLGIKIHFVIPYTDRKFT